MTKQEIKDLILSETGIEVRSRKRVGSMRDYTQFYIKKAGATGMKFNDQWLKSFVDRFPCQHKKGQTYTSWYSIEVHSINITN